MRAWLYGLFSFALILMIMSQTVQVAAQEEVMNPKGTADEYVYQIEHSVSEPFEHASYEIENDNQTNYGASINLISCIILFVLCILMGLISRHSHQKEKIK